MKNFIASMFFFCGLFFAGLGLASNLVTVEVMDDSTTYGEVNDFSISPIDLSGIQKCDSNPIVVVKPIFSSESGSYPYEYISKSGYFSIWSAHQKSHPKMLFVDKGCVSISDLSSRFSSFVRKKNDGSYQLEGLLLIGRNASLLIDNTSLLLDNTSGALIVNLGSLTITDSKVYVKDSNAINEKFNSFILNWNPSDVYIKDSQIHGLGSSFKNGAGLVLSENKHSHDSGPSRLQISGSVISGNYVGLSVSSSLVQIDSTVFENNKKHSVVSRNSSMSFADSRVLNTIDGAGMVCRFTSSNVPAQINVSSSIFSYNSGSGFELTNEEGGSFPVSALIKDNTFVANEKNGVYVNSLVELNVIGNKFLSNKGHGLEFFSGSSEQVRLKPALFFDNYFLGNTASALSSKKYSRFILRGNTFKSSTLSFKVFGGGLRFYQDEILKPAISARAPVLVTMSGKK
ncbi:MAG: right-handed parallel beta-helix repeat-containing protein [Porticoccus sp.]|nr:right-handed parallel beta-helix repeat-containing protein [Porticoccus sp.]MBQ0808547.1 right-handed parallel beta-helix repeat-containing protein [Porticoccus sp.]